MEISVHRVIRIEQHTEQHHNFGVVKITLISEDYSGKINSNELALFYEGEQRPEWVYEADQIVSLSKEPS